ncbi:protein of unknown function (plasmid) [Cupriavidus taiwanensis]|uniref:Uncharacterized protein n=2 Tax=Cupriavidus taiwanensis TaxID=164546 RepID=A0A7Z7JGF9_9BURK|nr:hypothetical protein CBM2597_U40032 [Cupriavidus taiwanensis]SOZ97233.1 hypothetical protein CBM2598_U40029 [Cupriavidus taiwanensis]SPC26126.1 hypothetical protein CBM2594_U40031 [Cupriavidus taiwanensis]SPD37743.1 protein of unknown function [Cupriavidus taiwanensis]
MSLTFNEALDHARSGALDSGAQEYLHIIDATITDSSGLIRRFAELEEHCANTTLADMLGAWARINANIWALDQIIAAVGDPPYPALAAKRKQYLALRNTARGHMERVRCWFETIE